MKCRMCLVGAVLAGLACGVAAGQEGPFLGRWALTPESGGAGWLEVRNDAGYFDGTLLWMGGSPEPQTRVFFDGDTLHALRVREDEVKDAAGKVVRKQTHPILVTATVSGDTMQGMFSEPASDGKSIARQAFTGVRIPDLPPAPDLSKVEFGKPVQLFNGRNLDGWVIIGGPHWAEVKSKRPEGGKVEGWVAVDDGVSNGWSVRDGVLVNDPVQHEGQPHIRYGNIATVDEFEDFNLTLDVNVLPNGNSGVYLRGIYEVQVLDSFGKPLDRHNMGAIYGRTAPTLSAEKAAGEWQTLDITLVDRHVTVKLNGQTILDNQPLMGCTGGALWSDEFRPGPIYLQGDHTGVEYRNILLRPVVRK
ncbi:MAG: DUF1080 domain-containing protein [Candidatus Hydrogenedentes bacterium]|nr:DUF1080 domain-containing protein [Candidatus Hydrogenedentota bacterium]